MTREEAKGNLIHAIRWNDMPKKESLEVAIKALEQEPCEDTISRQAVKELYYKDGYIGFRKICELPPVNPQPNKEDIHREREQAYMCGYEDASRKYRQEPKWITVSERLPEYGKEVLTCSNGGFIEIQSIEGTYGYWENQHGDWSDVDEVIAWMPLPTPYDPQESEE